MKIKRLKMNRRKFFWSLLLGGAAGATADAKWIEPDWLRVRRITLAAGKPTHRFVHFTDVHHKGDRAYLEKVVTAINGQSPDFVCFTGDIIEDTKHLPEALELFRQIKAPLYGVPGNHDYWSEADFDVIAECFAKTGGAWLVDQQTTTKDGRINLYGETGNHEPQLTPGSRGKNILLSHYPSYVKKLSARYDLILSGHSHGGQVRLPLYGAVVVPFRVDEFDLGLFQTKAGPMYVSSGIGWFYLDLRFLCRPEIVVFEI